jgi:hypothetical protein
MSTPPEITHNAEARRFETRVDGYLAVADYRLADGVMHMTHTEVPPRSRAAASPPRWWQPSCGMRAPRG